MARRGSGSGGAMDHQARYNVGALEQRVYGLEQSISGISQQIAGLSSKIDAGRQTNWGVLMSIAGFSLAFAGAVGGLAYLPIREAQGDLKIVAVETNKSISSMANQTALQFKEIAEKYVSVRELDQRSGRTRAEIDRINSDIIALEKVTVPRGEHEEKWRGNDREFQSMQRQIDDLKKFNTDLVSARDFLKNLDDRMRALELRRTP